jgi:hypothetical protein
VAREHIADLDCAIAALTLQDAPLTAAVAEPEIPEGFTKWKGGKRPVAIGTLLDVLTRGCGVHTVMIKNDGELLWINEGHDLDIIAYRIIEASDVEEAERIQGPSALVSSPGEGEESRDQFETTDPVLRAFEDDQIIAPPPWIDEQTCEPVNPHVEPEAPAMDESLLGPRDEDASVFSDEPPAEGYAPVTNPEADAVAGAHDYYSPEAQAEREREESFLNRFNPFRVKADA